MSRGLGKLQKRIVEHLETAGRWQTAEQVITAVTDSKQSEPSHSSKVVVRQAAQGLNRRGPHMCQASFGGGVWQSARGA